MVEREWIPVRSVKMKALHVVQDHSRTHLIPEDMTALPLVQVNLSDLLLHY
jgi:hypothetical protein